MKLSVIIPTRNRCDLLRKTLESILHQTMDKEFFEVIVVDNGSIDNTKQVVEKFKDSLSLIYFYEPKPGLHEGRHAGLRNSRSEILVYADDDIEAFPEWLETIYNIFQKNEKIGLVGGKNLPKFETSPPFWILEKWNIIHHNKGHLMGELSLLDLGDSEKEISPYYVFGCNFSVRKSIIVDAGGFHPDGMPFELIRFRGDGETYISEYIAKSDYVAWYHPKASIYHFVPKDRMTEDYFFKRNYCQGISDAYSHLRNSISDNQKIKKMNSLIEFVKVLLGIKQISLLRNIKRELEKTAFQKQLKLSYTNGYNYLITSYKFDEDVKKWIHKDKYL